MKTFVVTTNKDEAAGGTFDPELNRLIEDAQDGDGLSLREAIEAANDYIDSLGGQPGEVLITFDASFSGGNASIIRLNGTSDLGQALGGLRVKSGITIDGSTGTDILITGDRLGNDVFLEIGQFQEVDLGHPFSITNVALSKNAGVLNDNTSLFAGNGFELKSLTLTGGHTSFGDAGAIWGDATLNNVTIIGNANSGNTGGGGLSGRFDITDSIIAYNSAFGDFGNGGGIQLTGTTTIKNSKVIHNYAKGAGGGIGDRDSNPEPLLTIIDSVVSNNAADGRGGGIFNEFTINLERSEISENVTQGSNASGGGIFGKFINIANSLIKDNHTNGDDSEGGGIYSASTLDLRTSTISGNTTAGEESLGGGANVEGRAEIYNSTISGNTTFGDRSFGGGISLNDGIFFNATLHGNITEGVGSDGGGLYATSTTDVSYSTITGNNVEGSDANGSGVFHVDGNNSGSSIAFYNSIVLGNGLTADADADIHAGNVKFFPGSALQFEPPGSTAFNLIEGDDNNPANGAVDADINNVFAEVLNEDGISFGRLSGDTSPGSVQVVQLLNSSNNPALNAATGSLPASDDRDVNGNGDVAEALVDAAGNPRSIGDRPDLGAVEIQTPPPENKSLIVDLKDDIVDATDDKTSLREAITFANEEAGADTITFDPEVFSAGVVDTIHLQDGPLMISDSLTIDGTGQSIIISGDKLGNDVVNGTGISDMTAMLRGDGPQQLALLTDNTQVIISNSQTELRGLTISGGFSAENAAMGKGGGIHSSAQVILRDTSIQGNATVGDDMSGGGVYTADRLQLFDSKIIGNHTLGLQSNGGGFFADRLDLANSEISKNSTAGGNAVGGGGAVQTIANIEELVLKDNWTSGSESHGGGLAGTDEADIELKNSEITGNRTEGTKANGGALEGHSIKIENSIVLQNMTSGEAAAGGAVFSFGELVVNSSLVAENKTTGLQAHGGALATGRNPTLAGDGVPADNVGSSVALLNATLINNETNGNSAPGGAISTLDLFGRFSTITGNRTLGTNSDGGGIVAPGENHLTNMLVLGNVAVNSARDNFKTGVLDIAHINGVNIIGIPGGTFDTAVLGGDAPANFRDNFKVATVADVFEQTAVRNGVSHGVLKDFGNNNFAVPLRDHLQNPAIDAAALEGFERAPETDAVGSPRKVDLPQFAVGGAFDVGAFELQSSQTIGVVGFGRDDEFEVEENGTVEGNLAEDNGNGPDQTGDEPYRITAVNGDDDYVPGQQIPLASGGVITVEEDGRFTYDPNGAYDNLFGGQSAEEVFNYTVNGQGQASVSITVNGIGTTNIPVGGGAPAPAVTPTPNEVPAPAPNPGTVDMPDLNAPAVVTTDGDDIVNVPLDQGNQELDGGPGDDTVLIPINLEEVNIGFSENGYTFTTEDGTVLTTSNVETVRFNDVQLTLDTSFAAKAVTFLYEVMLDRFMDIGGITHWAAATKEGASLADIANLFVMSDEFNQNGPLTDDDFVDLLYVNGLDRPADSGGKAFWTQGLADGRFTRGDVASFFATSDEIQVLFSGPVEDGVFVIA